MFRHMFECDACGKTISDPGLCVKCSYDDPRLELAVDFDEALQGWVIVDGVGTISAGPWKTREEAVKQL